MVGTRGSRGFTGCCALVAAAAVLGGAARASGSVSAPDRQATSAYFQATYEYEVAVGAAARASLGSAAAFAGRVEAECPNAVSGLPPEGHTITNPKPRAEGEADRRLHQRLAIEIELEEGAGAAYHRGAAAARARFVAAVAPLRWGDPRVTAAVAAYLASAQPPEPAAPGPAEACADLRSWARSGFVRLAQRTKGILAAREAQIAGFADPTVTTLLRRYEGPAELAITRRIAREQAATVRSAFDPLDAIYSKLREAVGIPTPKIMRPPKVVTLARGRTHSGLHYRITEERPLPFHMPGCRLQVTVAFVPPLDAERGLIILGSSSPGLCVAGRAIGRAPELECEDGSLTIAQPLDPRARTVSLRLANGRTLTSRAIVLRPAHGAPAKLYVQALGRLSSPPVALTELGAGGAVLAVVRVPRHPRCPKAAAEEAVALPLVNATTPLGNPFRIEAVQFLGAGSKEPASLFVHAGLEDSSEVNFGGGAPLRAFDWSLRGGCEPGEWSIIYGMLKPRAASVTATTARGEIQLTTIQVPAGLHLRGTVLAYGAFAGVPSELTVRDAAGQVLATESLAGRASAHREFCAGYAEG